MGFVMIEFFILYLLWYSQQLWQMVGVNQKEMSAALTLWQQNKCTYYPSLTSLPESPLTQTITVSREKSEAAVLITEMLVVYLSHTKDLCVSHFITRQKIHHKSVQILKLKTYLPKLLLNYMKSVVKPYYLCSLNLLIILFQLHPHWLVCYTWLCFYFTLLKYIFHNTAFRSIF